ncbi:MAG: hypothetical protein J5I93_21950 [Pirellulaceae bacterium]|nr:hypothetical protein [Pirellulaceae bacterium]
MWRAVFLAVGITCCVLGAECLVVDKAMFSQPARASELAWYQFPPPEKPSEFTPPEWAPWSLLTGGAVILIYSITLNKGGEGG